MKLEAIRLATTKVLQIELINTKYFFFSLWSFVHLFAGGVIGYFLNKTELNKLNKFIILALILILYEVIEYFLIINFPYFFLPETNIDIISDIIIGTIGGSVLIFRR